jgi:hypothetical protein
MITLVLAYVFVLFIALLPFAWGVSSMISVVGGAPFVGTPNKLFPQIIELAGLKSNETFLELGSGLGELLSFVQKTGAQTKGIEYSPALHGLSKCRLRKKKNVTIKLGTAYDVDLSDVDVVFSYLLPPMMRRLEVKFAKELRPGARVVSYAFPLQNKEPTTIIPKTGTYSRIFLYTY